MSSNIKKEIKKISVSATDSIQATMTRINSTRRGIALVVDSKGKLLGTVTDGDMRRAILKDVPLQGPVRRIMSRKPVVLPLDANKYKILQTMVECSIRQVPLVDKKEKVVDMKFMEDMVDEKEVGGHRVLLMAGGKGKRLRPLTLNTPKPMLNVGGKPILETLITQLNSYGLRDISIAVRHKSKVIERYFKNGEKFSSSINYIKEKKKLGTAGALSLVRVGEDTSIIVMNGDVLTSVNFRALLDYHRQNQYDVTVCIRRMQIQVPFGVVDLENNEVAGIEEKPKFSFYVNAGVYVFKQAVQNSIPKNIRLDMPGLINQLKAEGKKIGGFPLIEYWLDVGHMEDYLLAHKEFEQIFGSENDVAKS